MSTSKMIELMSNDGESFEIEEAVAMKSQTLKNMIEDGCADNAIPLPNVTSNTLVKVIEYCKRHAEFEALDEKTPNSQLSAKKSFDSEFMKVDQSTLYDLMLAANYLDVKGLLDLTCRTVADMIKGKSPEEIRRMLHIKNDFTEEEEAQMRKENVWVFE